MTFQQERVRAGGEIGCLQNCRKCRLGRRMKWFWLRWAMICNSDWLFLRWALHAPVQITLGNPHYIDGGGRCTYIEASELITQCLAPSTRKKCVLISLGTSFSVKTLFICLRIVFSSRPNRIAIWFALSHTVSFSIRTSICVCPSSVWYMMILFCSKIWFFWICKDSKMYEIPQ